MSKISKLISEYLSIHDSVIIPGFGKISRIYFPSQLDRAASKISSPYYSYSFDFTIQEDPTDNFLYFIAKIEKLSFEDAAEMLQDYKKELLSSILNGEKVNIEGIGVFNADKETVCLTSDESQKKEWINAFLIEKKNNPQISNNNFHKKSDKIKNQSSRLLIGAVILTSLIISLVLFYKNNGIGKKHIDDETVIVDRNETEVIKDTTNSNDSITNIEESEPDNEKDKKTYLIIIGTYSNAEIAKNTENRLKSDGYKTQLKKLKNKQLRLAVSIEGQKADMEEALKELKTKYEKKAYLLD